MASKPVYNRQHETTNNIWATGQIIEANLLNNMQNQIAQNTQGFSNIVSYSDTQPSGDYSQYNQIWLKKANSSTDSIKLAEVKDLDKVVIISQEQPTDNLNKLWIKDDDNVVQVPSFNEFSQNIENNIAPPYLNTATYSIGQYVTYENKLYMCQTAVTTPGEWSVNSNHFIQTSIAGPLEYEGSAKGGWPNINANILNKLSEENSSRVQSVNILQNKVNNIENSIAPVYSETSYNIGDYCMYDGKLYKCKIAIINGEEWNSAHWTQVTTKDEIGDLKSTIDYDTKLIKAASESEIETIWAQGSLSGDSAYYIRSGYINVSPGDIIGVLDNNKYAFEVGVYNSGGSMASLSETMNMFVADSNLRIRLQTHNTNSIMSILPAEGLNVVFLRNYSGAIAHIPEIDAEIESIGDNIDTLDTKNNILAAMESITSASCIKLPGYFYYENGQSFTENANWNVKKVITDGNREFIISVDTATATGGIYVLSFYDSSNALLDHLYPLNTAVPTIKNMPIRVPEGTTYFYINSYQTEPIVYRNCAELLGKAIAKKKIQKIGTIPGKIFYPTTGQFVGSVSYTTDIYDIKNDTKYYISNVLRAATGFYSVLYFTSKTTFNADTYISAEYPVLKSLTIYPNKQCPLTIPETAVCFQLVYSNTDASYTGAVFTDIPSVSTFQISHLNGKKVTIIGDSITEYNYRAATNWAMWLEKWTGCTVQNLGISGTGFMRSNPYVNRITNIDSACDIIGVAASLNDLSGNSVIGTPTDTQQDNTVLGYANTFFTTLQSSYPSTPIICYMENPWEVYHAGVQRSDDYVTGIAQVCKNHGIPFYDELYTNGSVLRPWVYQNRLIYFTSDNPQYPDQIGTVDNVHPNSKGMNIIAGYLQSKFEQNVIFDD